MSIYEFRDFNNNRYVSYHPDMIDKRIEVHNTANWHSDLELLYCTEGEGQAIINSKPVPMRKGSITIINSNEIHYIAPISQIIRFQVLIVNSKFLKTSGIDIEKIDFQQSIKDAKAASLCEEIIDTISKRTDFSGVIANGLVLTLLGHICNLYITERKSSVNVDKMKKAIDYIHANYSEQISVDDIAKHVGFSRYYFSRRFKELSGFSVNEYIQVFRCHEAHAMLRTHEYTITEVAAACGFSDSAYFTRVYKKFFHKLPSDTKRKE